MATTDRSGCPATLHGTYSAYQHANCRCPDAREDWRLYYKRRRQGRATPREIDATGARRRIQALWAIGHTGETIGAATGWISGLHIQRIGRRKRVRTATAAAIGRAYEALSGTPGTSERTRRRAHAAGYLPPLAWDDETIDDPAAQPNIGGPGEGIVDEVAVQRAVNGEAGAAERLNPAERLEATRRLMRRGAGPGVVSKRLRMSGHAAAKLVGAVRAVRGEAA